MASTYSPLLRLELIGAGEQSGLWGETTNKNLGTLLEQAVAGVTTVSLSGGAGTYTLSSLNGTQDEARSAVLKFTGNPSGDKVIEIPTKEKLYVVRNDSGRTITVRTAAQITNPLLGGVEILNGEATLVFCDGNLAVAGIQTQDVGTLTVAKGGTGATSFTGGFVKSAGGTSSLTSAATVSLATEVSGTLPVGSGGTGRSTLATNAVLLGNGTGQVQQIVGTSNGQVLGWNGTTWTPTSTSGGITNVIGTAPVTASVVGSTATIALQNGTQAGQLLVWTGSDWQPQTISSGGVLTFNGRAGTVLPLAADYSGFYPVLTGAYDNPAWIIKLAGSKIDGSVSNSTALGGIASSGFLQTGGAVTQSVDGAKTFTGNVSFAGNVAIGINGILKGNGTSAITQAQTSDIQALLGTVGVANGGTGSTTFTAGGVLIGNGASAVSSVVGTGVGQILTWGGSSWVATNPTSGGTVTSITAGTGLSGGTIVTSGTIAVQANGITGSLFRKSAGLSVVGRELSTLGDVDDIVATSDHQVLRRSGSVLNFGALQLNQSTAVAGQLPVSNGGTGASTLTANGVLVGNGTAAVSSLTGTSIGQYLRWSGSAWVPTAFPTVGTVTSITAGTGLSGGTITGSGTIAIAADGVTYDLIQNATGLSVLGRAFSTTGNLEDIVAGTDGNVLRRSGTSLGFGTIDLASSGAVSGTLPVNRGGTGTASFTAGGGILKTTGGTAAFTVGTVSLSSEVSGTLPVSRGGTNATTFATAGVLKTTGGTAAFTSGPVSLTSDVSGVLPVGNGGTGKISITAGRLVVGNGTSGFSETTYAATDVATLNTDQTFTTKKTFTGQVVIGTPASIGSAPSITSGAYNFASATSIYHSGGTTFITINGGNQFKIDSNGDLAITGSNAIKATGSSPSWIVSSDRRLKENIVNYTKGLNELMQIQPKQFTYNGKGGSKAGMNGVGIIADEIKQVLPDTVGTRLVKFNSDDKTETEIQSFDFNEVNWVMVNAIKELKAEVDSLKAQLAAK